MTEKGTAASDCRLVSAMLDPSGTPARCHRKYRRCHLFSAREIADGVVAEQAAHHAQP